VHWIELHRRLSVAQEDAANERSRNAALLQQLAEQRQLLRIAQLDCSSFESEAEQMGREAVRGRSERKDLERRVEALKDQLWVLRQPRDQQRQESNYTMQRTHYSHSTTVVQRPHYSGEAGQVLAEQLIAAVQDQPSYRWKATKNGPVDPWLKFSSSIRFECHCECPKRNCSMQTFSKPTLIS